MELMDAVGTMNNLLRLPKDTHGEFTRSKSLHQMQRSLAMCMYQNNLPLIALSQRVFAKHRDCPEGRAVFVTVLKAMDTEQVVDFIVKENSS